MEILLTLLCTTFCFGFGWYIMSNRPLPKSGSVGGLWCPNVVSFTGTVMCVLTYYVGWVWFKNFPITMAAYTFWAMFDAIDGKIARKHDESRGGSTEPDEIFGAWFFHLGTSDRGALFDSSCDKVKITLIYAHAVVTAGWMSLFFIAVIAVDLWAGKERLQGYEPRKKAKAKGGNHSEWVGKWKTWIQQLCLFPLILRELAGDWILAGCMSVALGFTVASVTLRKYKERKLRQEAAASPEVRPEV